MKRGFFCIAVILLLHQLIGCTTIYQSVKDKRDKNYQEGIELYNQNKLEDAHDRFKTVVDIEPDYRDAKRYLARVEGLINLKKKQIQQKANWNYKKGIALMKNHQYEPALNYLLEAQNDDPDIVDIKSKIEDCRKKLVPKLKETLKQAEWLYERKRYIQAYWVYLKTKVYDPSNHEASVLKGKIEDRLDEKAKKFRVSGKEYYKKKQYAAAQQQFQLALNNHPWDSESKEWLDKTNNKLNLDKYYNNAIAVYNKGNYFNAKYLFIAVNNIESGYKATDQYLNKINAALISQVPAIYNNGLALYEKGNYQSAITEFNKVLSINPGHTMAQEYRQRAQSKLDIQKSLQGGASQ